MAAVERAWALGKVGIVDRVHESRPCSAGTQALLFGILLEHADPRSLTIDAGQMPRIADLGAGYFNQKTTTTALRALEDTGLLRVERRGKRIVNITITPPQSVLRPEQPSPNVKTALRAAVMERDGFACRYCRCTDDLTLDHIVPRRLGGAHALDNLVTACRPCNSRKGPQTPEQAGMSLLEVPQ